MGEKQTENTKSSCLDLLSQNDRYAVDSAAQAWVNAGGDAEGINFMWREIRDRVEELKGGGA